MKSTKRLEELLDLKSEKIREEEEREEWRWALPREVKNAENLPVPRLEMRCVQVSDNWYNWRWEYALIYKHFLGHFVAVPLGQTTVGGGRNLPPIFEGRINTPFRDGTHICHDSQALGLPAFALCDGLIALVAMKDGKVWQEPHKALMTHEKAT